MSTSFFASLNFSNALPETIMPKMPRLNVTTPVGMSVSERLTIQTNAHTLNGRIVTNRNENTRQNRVDDKGFARDMRSLKKLILAPAIRFLFAHCFVKSANQIIHFFLIVSPNKIPADNSADNSDCQHNNCRDKITHFISPLISCAFSLARFGVCVAYREFNI